MSHIKFSIVIPTYKRATLLKEAISSALCQKTDSIFEVLIVDDDPSESARSDSQKIISLFNDFRIRYYQNKTNLGCFENMNQCVKLARFDYIVMLHNDDILYDNYLSTIECVLRKNKNIDMILPDEAVFVNERKVKKTGYQKINNYINKFTNLAGHPIKITQSDFFIHNIAGGPTGVLFKKNKAIEAGLFDNTHYPVADYYFLCKYASLFNVYMITNELSEYRQKDNITLSDGVFPEIFKQSLKLQKALCNEGVVKGFLAKCYSYESIRLRILSINKKSNLSLDKDECYRIATGAKYKKSVIRMVLSKFFLYIKSITWIVRVFIAK